MSYRPEPIRVYYWQWVVFLGTIIHEQGIEPSKLRAEWKAIKSGESLISLLKQGVKNARG